MNNQMIRHMMFRMLQITGLIFILPMIVALIYGEVSDGLLFAMLAIICFCLGTLLTKLFQPTNKEFYAREGFVVTALSWIMISAIGALAFWLSGSIPSYIDALFETVSGYTTTGSSIMTDPAVLGKGMQFFRLSTHWYGGMGVLVFMLAVLPMTEGGYSMHLMRAESPGPAVGKFVPRVADTARILYLIYMGITAAEIVALLLTGMSFYDSVTMTFSTVGTGGFGLTGGSANDFSSASQTVITIFMILCGTNFSVYYLLLRKRWKEALLTEEVRVYLLLMFGSAAIIALNIYYGGVTVGGISDPALAGTTQTAAAAGAAGLGTTATPGFAFHHALFTVASIMTTTGLGTLDFNNWPALSRTILFILTLVGACAGSTGGGFKISRVMILFRNAKNEILFMMHPKSMKRVSMDGHRVEGTTVKSVSAYLWLYVMIFAVSFLLLSIDGFDFETNLTAVAANLNNVGPGLSMVGPTGNYASFSVLSKLVLIFDMLAGRLEILPMLILFYHRTWNKCG